MCVILSEKSVKKTGGTAMADCKVSIVIPVYNVEQYLAYCLDSVFGQTLTEIEVIAVNDGSTDGSLEILKTYEASHKKQMTVYSTKNQGVSHARNYGLKQAHGEFVLFVDSDDFLEPEMCEKMYLKAIQDQNDVVLCNYYAAYYNPEREKFIKKTSRAYHINFSTNFNLHEQKFQLTHISPFPWDKLYRRSLLQRFSFPEGIRFEDLAVVYRIVCAANSIGVLKEYLYNYRKTNTGSFLSSFSEGTLDITKALETLVDGLKKDGYFEEFYEEIEFICTRHILIRYNSMFQIENRKKLELKLRLISESYDFLDSHFKGWQQNHYLRYSTSPNMRAKFPVYCDREVLTARVKKEERLPLAAIKLRSKLKASKKKLKRGWRKFKRSQHKFRFLCSRIPFLKLFHLPKDVVYTRYYEKLPVNENLVLFESKHGDDLAGNIFYMLMAMKEERYRKFQIVLVMRTPLFETIQDLLKRYEMDYVVLEDIQSKNYQKLLATAKYLITDTSFPTYYIKRPEQVYLNTWHGTPLKAMGRIVPKREYGLANVQRNFLIADYLLYQNEFSRDVFLNDYMLPNLYQGKVMLSGYPRNSAFFREERYSQIRRELELTEMKVMIYMPTWRGLLTKKENKKQIEELTNYFYELDDGLEDDQILFVKLHPFVKSAMNLEDFDHIRAFPEGYETYDFLNASDLLITDYSSIMFDYAVSKKRIILFTYDREEYLADRGMYLDLDNLEFPKADNVEELIEAINQKPKKEEYPQFFEQFCRYDCAKTADKVCETLFFGKKAEFSLEPVKANGKKNVLIFTKGGEKGVLRQLVNMINEIDSEKYNFFLCAKASELRKTTSILSELNRTASYLPLSFDANFTIKERLMAGLSFKFGVGWKSVEQCMEKIAERENLKYFGTASFDIVINYSSADKLVLKMCQKFQAVTIMNLKGFSPKRYQESRKYRNSRNYIFKRLDRFHYIIAKEDLKEFLEQKIPQKSKGWLLDSNTDFNLSEVLKEVEQ